MTAIDIKTLPEITVKVKDLLPHPRNYKFHPPDQIVHIAASISRHGIYRNIVVARDRRTILAGHGVTQGLVYLEVERCPARILDADPLDPDALELMVADNEVEHLGEKDDRALATLLKEIRDDDPSRLLGTGYDDMMIANLLMVTRPASEIADFDAAAEWVGMPEYEEEDKTLRLIMHFDSEADRETFVTKEALTVSKKLQTWSAPWPTRPNIDRSSVRYEDGTSQ